MSNTIENDPWLELRNAIVEQAAIDYKVGLMEPKGHQKLRNEAEAFFKGQWCDALLGMDNSDVTGRAILRRLKDYTLQELKSGQKETRMKVELLQQTEKPIDTIVKIASICYDSRPANKMAMVKHLYLNGHHSPFEHVYFTFKLTGISRACSHQLVRHRLCAFTQRSQRYCGENGFEYVEPDAIRKEDKLDELFTGVMKRLSDEYTDLVHLNGIQREDARYLLPNACATELVLSCNLRELIHIANERLCSRAQWEIRQVVQQMVKLVDKDLQWMLVPKCKSGFLICNCPCQGKGYTLMRKGE